MLARVVWCAAVAACVGCADRDPSVPRAEDGGAVIADAGGESDAGLLRRRDGGGAVVDAGAGSDDGGGIPVLPPEVVLLEAHGAVPTVGPTAGGTPVTISGRGFVSGTRVTVGGQMLVDAVIAQERRITGRTPPGVAGVASILIENRVGRAEVRGGFTYQDDVALTGVTPIRGPREGGTELVLTGNGFTPGAAVLVGTRPALDVRVDSPTRIRAMTPTGDRGGPVRVSIVGRSGLASRADAFTYVDVPSAFTLRPVAGPLAGGGTVTMLLPQHNAELAGASVLFGDRVAPSVVVRGPTELLVTVPGGAAVGSVDVALVTADGSVVAPRGYAYFGTQNALSVQAVLPASGPLEGGNDVRVVGTGFDSGVSEVRVGGALASAIGLESAQVLRVTAPPGAEGLADVAVFATGGRVATLTRVYRYESRLALSGVAPAEGPVAGGTLVQVRGEGFGPDTRVFFGPLAATDLHVVDAGELYVRTPAASAGSADVTVRAGVRSAVLPRAFTYLDAVRLARVTPGRGGMAGGTWVNVTGTGFTPNTRAFFGGVPGVEAQFVDAYTLAVRTPPGAAGYVDVAIAGERGAAVLPRAYEYFDPAVAGGGATGGVVRGSVHVTVLDGTDGTRISGAYATLAVTGATLYQGITNRAGQVTFSGPDLSGRQVVTAAKEGYSATTVVATDAPDITVFLNPLNVASGLQPGGELSTIRGLVRDAFKGIPTPPVGYQKAVIVTTSQADRFTPNPPAPGIVDILRDTGSREDLPFEVLSRPGDVALYGLAGHLSADGRDFVSFQMGLVRHLDVPVAGNLEDVLLTIGTALSARLEAPLLNAPPLGPDGPTAYRMRVYLELGSDGALTFFRLPESTSEPRLVHEHLVPLGGGLLPNARYTVVAGAYNVVDGDEFSPLVQYTEENITDLSQPVPLGPMMALASPVSPADIDFLEGNRFVWSLVTPPTPGFSLVYVLQPGGLGFVSLWEMIVPGVTRQVQLPDLRALGGLTGIPSGEVLYWAILSVEGPTFSIDDFRYDALSPARWKNYSIAPYIFITR